MQHILALSRHAVIVRHWFEIDLEDASMEHGVRIELRELAPQPHADGWYVPLLDAAQDGWATMRM